MMEVFRLDRCSTPGSAAENAAAIAALTMRKKAECRWREIPSRGSLLAVAVVGCLPSLGEQVVAVVADDIEPLQTNVLPNLVRL